MCRARPSSPVCQVCFLGWKLLLGDFAGGLTDQWQLRGSQGPLLERVGDPVPSLCPCRCCGILITFLRVSSPLRW